MNYRLACNCRSEPIPLNRQPLSHIDHLIGLLARLPGLGPRSARRAALALIKRPDTLMEPLARALNEAAENILACTTCGNVDTRDPCGICLDVKRDGSLICVVEDVADLWAMERTHAFKGRYHVGRNVVRIGRRWA